jgi:hypothetical protein
MSETNFPWDKPQKNNQQDVQYFIDAFRKYLAVNQIELLEHFKDKIYGFHLQSHNQHGSTANPNRLNHEALFVFEHLGVKGEITVSF